MERVTKSCDISLVYNDNGKRQRVGWIAKLDAGAFNFNYVSRSMTYQSRQTKTAQHERSLKYLLISV